MSGVGGSGTITVGDRVRLRDRPWRVASVRPLSVGCLLEVEALDGADPGRLSVVSPPDEPAPLPPAELTLDRAGFDSFASWARLHHVLAAGCVGQLGSPSGALSGRVALEAYQLAPTLRLLSKPRPSLLVGDDVGLGKTIEAAMAILELEARGRAGRVLIVTPPGLLYQWRDELLEKFGLQFEVIESAAGLARVQAGLPAGVSPWDAVPRVLASIDYIKKDTVRHRVLRKRWDLVIVDEAHSLAESGTPENPYRTHRTRLGQELRDNSRGLLLLTATPHNGYGHSFRSLIELVEPSAATLEGDTVARLRRVDRAMIRRMKPQIKRRGADGKLVEVFPRRRVQGIAVETDGAARELLQKVAAYCSRTARQAEGIEGAELITFAMQIVKKRALSSRRALARTIENRLEALRKGEEETPPAPAEVRDLQADLPLGEALAERTATRILRAAIPKEVRLRKAEARALNALRRLLKQLPEEDPKVERLLREIRAVIKENPSEKIIIFTEYLDTLGAISERIEGSKDLAGRTAILRGGLSLRRRIKVQERFEGPDVNILLATDAASEGLNLQHACRRVIHVELPWNPNRLEQRNGRVDRYGQKRTPEIRYLYYPDSPEDDVLHRIVEKVESMQEDRVSTPDILGMLQGIGLDERLVALNPEKDVEAGKDTLLRLFDDRTAEFIRDVKPLLASADVSPEVLPTLGEAIFKDDTSFESVALALLGPHLRSTAIEGVHRIDVPLAFRGAGVEPSYARATFRRSVAARFRAADVEFITRLHPLARAMSAEARRRLLQVYPDQQGIPPRRLAARRVASGEAASVVVTFHGAIAGTEETLEESMLPVRVTADLRVAEAGEKALRWLDPTPTPGEVPVETVEKLFTSSFSKIVECAASEAHKILKERAEAIRLGSV